MTLLVIYYLLFHQAHVVLQNNRPNLKFRYKIYVLVTFRGSCDISFLTNLKFRLHAN